MTNNTHGWVIEANMGEYDAENNVQLEDWTEVAGPFATRKEALSHMGGEVAPMTRLKYREQ